MAVISREFNLKVDKTSLNDLSRYLWMWYSKLKKLTADKL